MSFSTRQPVPMKTGSHSRRGSATTTYDPADPPGTVITVVRNGKVYHSKKTRDGELNSRGRRKERRAAEREAAAFEAANRQAEVNAQAGWIGETPKADVFDDSAVRAALAGYDLSSWKFPTPSPSSPSYRSKAPPPLNPFMREGSPSAGIRQTDLLAPPLTPSASGSDDGRASSPHSSHSRSSSLNANAPVFSPTGYRPLTPRSPCSSNGNRSRSGSVSGAPGAPGVEGAPESPLCSRRHSMALAAWESAQKRKSHQRSESMDLSSMQRSAEQYTSSPITPLSAQSWAPGATYGDVQGWAYVASPTGTHGSGDSWGRARSGSLAALPSYTGGSGSDRKGSLSSSAGARSAGFSSFMASEYNVARRESLPPTIANVHAQYGLDPDVDQLADLGYLVHDHTALGSPPILEELSSRDIRRMENALVQPRPVRRSARLTGDWVAEQNGRSKRRSPLTSNSELDS
ncbi:hypothetical protein FRB90_006594 [Tulasnella sp. 427]|nr:hypothetical protein FRB90_006594 [Tulasnella sp. 427]